MGNLTEDMTRLRGEVDALRGAREALMQDLTRGAKNLSATVSAMRADFSAAHAAMAKQTREERGAFVAAVIDDVNFLLGKFSRERNDMARKGRDDRGAFLAEMRREVMGLCKDTANDLMGARLVWRGERPGKPRPVPLEKKPVVPKPVPPVVEAAPALQAAPAETVAAPEIKAEQPPVTFMEPLKKEEEQKTVAVPEFKTESLQAKFMEPLKKEAEKKPVAAPEAPVVKTPKVKAPSFVSTSKPLFLSSKEKNLLDEKPAKVKRDRKLDPHGF